VLTHFKGHACCGIGGSIKNLGMGALTKESKGEIHAGSKPELGGECMKCRKCLEVCPVGCIRYDEAGPVFDLNACYGCSKCIQNCPQACLKPKVAEFDALLADGASAAYSRFRKSYCVNVLRNIMNRCDCQTSQLERVADDIGIMIGRDIVAIDKASLELVNEKVGRKVFDAVWHKDSELQIREAENLGLGSMAHTIISCYAGIARQSLVHSHTLRCARGLDGPHRRPFRVLYRIQDGKHGRLKSQGASVPARALACPDIPCGDSTQGIYRRAQGMCPVHNRVSNV